MALGVALHSIAADKAVTNPDTEKPAHEKKTRNEKKSYREEEGSS